MVYTIVHIVASAIGSVDKQVSRSQAGKFLYQLTFNYGPECTYIHDMSGMQYLIQSARTLNHLCFQYIIILVWSFLQ